jgi:integrase
MGCGLAALSQIALALVYDARRRPAADDRERLPRSLPAGLRNLLPTDFDREADKVKALSELELAALLRALPEASRPFLAFLAETGLRIGEAIELRWRTSTSAAAGSRLLDSDLPESTVLAMVGNGLATRTTETG